MVHRALPFRPTALNSIQRWIVLVVLNKMDGASPTEIEEKARVVSLSRHGVCMEIGEKLGKRRREDREAGRDLLAVSRLTLWLVCLSVGLSGSYDSEFFSTAVIIVR